jgi:hypothetical protein
MKPAELLARVFMIALLLAGGTLWWFVAPASASTGTIDAVNRYAWSANAGWLDFGTTQGNVQVTDSALTGYAWGENIGWISLNCSNDGSCGSVSYGVANDGSGNLSGYAWSANAGWINFDPAGGGVVINPSTGVFSGYAWGEDFGWISFNCETTDSCGTVEYEVSTDWRPATSPPVTTSSLPPSVSISPGGGSAYDLSINGGAPTTATTSVTLSLYGTAAYTMEVSNASTFAGAAWIPYVTTMSWALAPDPGMETVYAQFKAVGGVIVGSAQASTDLVPAGVLPSAPSSSSSLSDELKALQARLAALQALANQSTSSSTHFAFPRNLELWDRGADVTALQAFLIREDAGPAARALGKHGTSTTFGSLTYHALIELQQHAGITPASGYFGPKTRAWVNAHE